MSDAFIKWMKEGEPREGDGYLIPDPLVNAIAEHPELLEGVAESDIEMVIRFDGQYFSFYRVGYIFDVIKRSESGE